MVTTIQQVLHPFFILCFITGLDFYPRKQPRIQWTVNLSILYSLTIWFAYIYVLYFIIIGFRGIISTSGKIIHEISTFTTIVSAIMSHYHQKRFTICLKKLAIVDDSLEELGTPKMYQKMHMWSKIVIIGWLVLSLFTNFYDSLWWLKKSGNAYVSYALNHSIHINTLVDLLFISILWYVGTRFDKVNEHMQYLLVREEHGLRCTWEKPDVIVHRYILYTDNYKRTLWILMHVHLELCRLARELNMIFGMQMTLEMTSCFLYLTGLCHWLCQMVMREYNDEEKYTIYLYFRQGTWLFLFLLKLYTVNYMCENVSLKANQIDKIIHKLSNTLRYADVWKEICQFTLQITYHQLKFTGMGLFYFGNSFLRKWGTTVVTFVLIMRQMKIA
ncbi:putative gustatory receptor 28b isoform X1 [Temnothorax longispinosus]|uniref:putative gustatory receptor 28b isoform X1 n=1 Tax=Temnothorax longispinosus TaxID=300112 RepID=UPI003A996557